MNKLLQKAFEKAAELPDEKQHQIAEIVLDEIKTVEEWGDVDGDARWEELFARPESQVFLEKMVDKVREDIRARSTKPLRIEDP